MGEFKDLRPNEFAEGAERLRAQLQQQKDEIARQEWETKERQARDQNALLSDAENKTVELFEFLKAAFHGHKISTKQSIVVERRGSRPEGIGFARINEKPAWVIIRADSTTLNPRHEPFIHFSPEYILAARCATKRKYELLLYPIKRQDRPEGIETDDRDQFLTRIQREVASR